MTLTTYIQPYLKAYLNITSLSVPGWPPASAFSRNLDPNKNQKLASKSSHICCIGIKIYQKNGYIPYESGILVCLLVIFGIWPMKTIFFVVFNELIGIQNQPFFLPFSVQTSKSNISLKLYKIQFTKYHLLSKKYFVYKKKEFNQIFSQLAIYKEIAELDFLDFLQRRSGLEYVFPLLN